MSNKTALQEILSKLKEHEHLYGNMYPQFESWLKEFLEKEKQQIMEAYQYYERIVKDGDRFMYTAEGYYEAKYGNPQGDPETKQ
ncbi:hypothetical protein [Elizabethkingia anophelis]|uniref:Uncharacterized protein n=1 Tax=Elizabethkingia anophelis TaxID=1117645 RepID=A0A7Z7LU29_9FLAO|nr:hypothetical protein [Elizabethkingia anophelis]MDV3630455.1 hypothetical protein [Elizabethkingia anophelis]MDV3704739.1 hypothetical protein [Elizabethkingia anophelis]MDV3722949.1 hypothetical protein [Elizabethkingia anophelis]MDV4113408.1 hypothetical protein [Elizabethkingia anophelis]STC97744.1 Uncharacterised protein [Elizabethkingia anophelis]